MSMNNNDRISPANVSAYGRDSFKALAAEVAKILSNPDMSLTTKQSMLSAAKAQGLTADDIATANV